MEAFDLKKADSSGYVPEEHLVGTSWKHFKGLVYTIRGFAWNGETDRWMLLHNRTGNMVMCSRTPENFFGVTDSGVTRYTVDTESIVDDGDYLMDKFTKVL